MQTAVKLLFEKTDFDRAIADFDRAIWLDPKDVVSYNSRGRTWGMKGEYDKAIADFDEAIRINPLDDESFFCRGLVWLDKKEHDKAIADFHEAIRINPDGPGAYDARAWIWATCPDEKYRDGKRAVESATKACELSQWNEPYYMETLAAACPKSAISTRRSNGKQKPTTLMTMKRARLSAKRTSSFIKRESPSATTTSERDPTRLTVSRPAHYALLTSKDAGGRARQPAEAGEQGIRCESGTAPPRYPSVNGCYPSYCHCWSDRESVPPMRRLNSPARKSEDLPASIGDNALRGTGVS